MVVSLQYIQIIISIVKTIIDAKDKFIANKKKCSYLVNLCEILSNDLEKLSLKDLTNTTKTSLEILTTSINATKQFIEEYGQKSWISRGFNSFKINEKFADLTKQLFEAIHLAGFNILVDTSINQAESRQAIVDDVRSCD